MAIGDRHTEVKHRLTADERPFSRQAVPIPGSRLDFGAHPTDFKVWNESLHPRDDHGRFGEGRGNYTQPDEAVVNENQLKPDVKPIEEKPTKKKPLGAKALAGVKTVSHADLLNDMVAKITVSNKKQLDKKYGDWKGGGVEYIRYVIHNGIAPFSEEANRRIARNIRRVQVLENQSAVQAARGSDLYEGKVVKAAAFYSSSESTAVFGEIESDTVTHEFAHAVDRGSGIGNRTTGFYSSKPDWMKIWKEEIVAGNKFREYAKFNEREGFACAIQYIVTNRMGIAGLKLHAPRTYAYLVKKKLIVTEESAK